MGRKCHRRHAVDDFPCDGEVHCLCYENQHGDCCECGEALEPCLDDDPMHPSFEGADLDDPSDIPTPKELHIGEAPKRIPRERWHTQTAFGDDCRFMLIPNAVAVASRWGAFSVHVGGLLTVSSSEPLTSIEAAQIAAEDAIEHHGARFPALQGAFEALGPRRYDDEAEDPQS